MLVSFIKFCLASGNDEAVNIPVIILASFLMTFVCEKSVSWLNCTCAVHVTLSQCLKVSGFLMLFFCSFQLCVFNANTCSIVVLWTFILLFILPVLLQSLTSPGCLRLKDSCCFNASSPFPELIWSHSIRMQVGPAKPQGP